MPVSKTRKNKKKQSRMNRMNQALIGIKNKNHSKYDNVVMKSYADGVCKSLNDKVDKVVSIIDESYLKGVELYDDIFSGYLKEYVEKDKELKDAISKMNKNMKEECFNVLDSITNSSIKFQSNLDMHFSLLRKAFATSIESQICDVYENFKNEIEELQFEFSKDRNQLIGLAMNMQRVEFIHANSTIKLQDTIFDLKETFGIEMIDIEKAILEEFYKNVFVTTRDYFDAIGNQEIVDIINIILENQLNELEEDKYLDILEALVNDHIGDVINNIEDIAEKLPKKVHKEKLYKYIELNKMAEDSGYIVQRHNGDHAIFEDAKGQVVVIPQGREIGRGLQKKILKNINR